MIAGAVRNIRCGPNITDVFDVKLHPTRDAGGNPLLIYRHGGGGTKGYKDSLWDDSWFEGDALINYLVSASRAVHFDIVSMESDQAAFSVAEGKMPRSRRVHFPEIVTSFQRNVRNAKMIMHQKYGSKHDDCILWGSSHGSWLILMSMLMQPDIDGPGQRPDQRRRFETRGYSSRAKGALPFTLAYPDFRRRDMADGWRVTNVAVAGTAVGTTPDPANPFGGYRFVAGDHFVITSGTGSVAPGTYTVAARNADNDRITLSSGAGTGTATGYLTSDYVWPSAAEFLFGTRSAAADYADGQYAEWDAVPASMKEAASPLFWIQQGQTAFCVPTLFWSNMVGAFGATRPHPWGAPAPGSTELHDETGVLEMHAALLAQRVSSTYLLSGPSTDWSNNIYPKYIYDWMVSLLG